MQGGDRLDGLGPQIIANTDHSHHLVVRLDNGHGHALPGHVCGPAGESLRVDPARAADPHPAAVDGAGEAATGIFADLGRLQSGRRRCDDGVGQRMAAGRLQRGSESEHMSLGAVVRGVDGDDPGAVEGQGASFVEHDSADGPELLERAPGLDDHSEPARRTDCGDHRYRHRDRERARRGRH